MNREKTVKTDNGENTEKQNIDKNNGAGIKDKKKRLSVFKYILVAAAVLIAMFPDALINSQTALRTLITAVGIDRAENGEYRITAQMVLPQPSADQPPPQNVVTYEGKTLRAALDGISVKTGRASNLSHCKLIFLGKQIIEEDAVSCLDFFIRASEINNGIMIAAVSGKAKESITNLAGFDKVTAYSLPDFLYLSRTNNFSTAMTLKNYMETYYSGIGDMYMPVVKIVNKEEETEGGGESGGEGTNPELPMEEMHDDYETAVIKDGKLATVLNKEKTRALIWLDRVSQGGRLMLENVKCGGEEVIMSMSVRGKDVRVKPYFDKDGKPVYDVRIKLKTALDEVERHTKDGLDIYAKELLAAEIREKAQQKIEKALNDLLQTNIDGGFDVMKIGENFYRRKNKQYKKFIANGGDLMKECRLNVSIKIEVNI